MAAPRFSVEEVQLRHRLVELATREQAVQRRLTDLKHHQLQLYGEIRDRNALIRQNEASIATLQQHQVSLQVARGDSQRRLQELVAGGV